MLSLSVASPIRLAQAQKNGDGGASSPLKYPETKTVETVDDYFGTKVADPYRWLENNDSPEVAAWVEAQNKVTFAYLDQIPYRSAVKDRLTKLFNYPKYGSPRRRGEWFILIEERRPAEPERLATFKKVWMARLKSCSIRTSFPPTALRGWGIRMVDTSGKYIGYGISKGGSDWNDLHVLDVATKKPLTDRFDVDEVLTASRGAAKKASSTAAIPRRKKAKKLTTKNEFQKVYYHKLGTPQSEDELVYEDKATSAAVPRRRRN